MTIEIIFLALVNTVRPTSLAAVYAMLSTDRSRRLLSVYLLSGLAFTVSFGLLIVWAFNGANLISGTSTTEAFTEVIGGAVLLAFAFAVLTGLVGGRHAEDAPRPGGRLEEKLKQRLTMRTAAVAGPLTHIPGLFYLVALNIIVGHQPGFLVGLIEVLIYNVIWFAIPIGALGISAVEPQIARSRVEAINRWARNNTRAILVVVSATLGAILLLRGLTGI